MSQMKTQRGFKTELDLNNSSGRLSAACRCGALCVQLWAAAQAEAYQAGEKVSSAIDLHRELNRLKQTDYLWLYETSKCAPQEALRDLDGAFAQLLPARRRVARLHAHVANIRSDAVHRRTARIGREPSQTLSGQP